MYIHTETLDTQSVRGATPTHPKRSFSRHKTPTNPHTKKDRFAHVSNHSSISLGPDLLTSPGAPTPPPLTCATVRTSNSCPICPTHSQPPPLPTSQTRRSDHVTCVTQPQTCRSQHLPKLSSNFFQRLSRRCSDLHFFTQSNRHATQSNRHPSLQNPRSEPRPSLCFRLWPCNVRRRMPMYDLSPQHSGGKREPLAPSTHERTHRVLTVRKASRTTATQWRSSMRFPL